MASSATYVKRVFCGDTRRKEFLSLYTPVHEQFTRYCRAISGNVPDAEDLIQESVLISLETFDKIKDKNAFKYYIFSIAGNVHKMKLRRLKFKAEFNEEEIRKILDVSQNQEYLTDFGIVYTKILQLPQRMAEAIILFHISGLSLEEIRKIQGGSLSGVKLRIKRGREKLLSSLKT
ncbi:MAG: RNA polymerase sigma factor, partial [Bacteroidales bacterium]|nr:RNA polymerase sigma factor [Bacteroidales bacterium]